MNPVTTKQKYAAKRIQELRTTAQTQNKATGDNAPPIIKFEMPPVPQSPYPPQTFTPADISDDDALILMEFNSEDSLAELFGVHKKTVRRWRRRQCPIPLAVKKLAWLIFKRRCFPIGKACTWDGFTIGRDNLLYAPDMKDGFSAGEVRFIWYSKQFMFDKQCDSQKLRKVEAELEYYKRQVILEARLGLALQLIDQKEL